MPVEYSKLASGTQISDRSYVVDQETVSAYVAAVGDRSELSSVNEPPMVPPMAVAALSLRGVIDDLAIPGGTLHVGQELEFKSSVSIRQGDADLRKRSLALLRVEGATVSRARVDDRRLRRE